MTDGKPYRYGLIAAGLGVAAVGLFIMTQERPHVYATLCALGVAMVAIGTAWSLCQCYPKVMLIPQDNGTPDRLYIVNGEKVHSRAEPLASVHEEKPSDTFPIPRFLTKHCTPDATVLQSSHSCPTLHIY